MIIDKVSTKFSKNGSHIGNLFYRYIRNPTSGLINPKEMPMSFWKKAIQLLGFMLLEIGT